MAFVDSVLEKPAQTKRNSSRPAPKERDLAAEAAAVDRTIQDLLLDKLVAASALPMEVEIITPEIANDFLKNNPINRTISKSLVHGYARDIKSGNWEFTGDPIRFAKDGRLIDGQHRLKACVHSGIPFVALVIRDLDPKIQDVLDIGRKRSLSDFLTLSGRGSTVRLVAMARWILYIKNKHISNADAKVRVTNRELKAVVDRHPNMEESAAISYASLGLPASLLATIHYIGHNLLEKEQQANDFVAAFVSSKQSYPDDAAIVWRERLLRMKERQTKMNRDLILRGTINCWNQYAAREPAKIIRIPETVKITGLDYSKL